ncbi:hypothetical protein K2X33_11805 [bacterium]|nr:hypothetical protein [bacterium]
MPRLALLGCLFGLQLWAAPRETACQVSVADRSFEPFIFRATNLQADTQVEILPVEKQGKVAFNHGKGTESYILHLPGYRMDFDHKAVLGGLRLSFWASVGHSMMPLFMGEVIPNNTYIVHDLREVGAKRFEIHCTTK